MKLFVVILNWNAKDYIAKCLKSVLEMEAKSFDLNVLVVDNGSTDGSDKLVSEKFKTVKLIKTGHNLGYTGGNNFGLKSALKNGADYILILNPDTLLDKSFGESLVAVANKDKNIGVIGPKIYFAPGYEFHKERYTLKDRGKVIWYAGGTIDWRNMYSPHRGVNEIDKGQYETRSETDFVSGCAMFVRREVFEKIGLFDERYYLYWEDVDFSQRARLAGFKVIYSPAGRVWHMDAAASSVGGSLHDYYLIRSRLLFGMRYAPLRTKFALLRESFRLFFGGRHWQKEGVKDYFLGKFGRAVISPGPANEK